MSYKCARHMTTGLLEEHSGILDLEPPMTRLIEHAAIMFGLVNRIGERR